MMSVSPPWLDLPRARQACGTVALPGSKSISNRVLLLAALADGATDVVGLLDSDDTRVMLAALRQLGVAVENQTDGAIRVTGGASFLTAALALMGGDYRLSGVPRMHERPIGDLVDALRSLGAKIDYLGQTG